MVLILKKLIKNFVNESQSSRIITAYHGSNFDNITSLNADFMGSGNDQYGPGMYFSSSIDLARGYGKYIYTAELNLKRVVPSNQILSNLQIQSFIKQAPDYAMTLTDFGESPSYAMRMAIQAMADSGENAVEQLQSIWYDFYRNSVPDFVRTVAKIFDASIIPVENNVNFYILYNPASIRIMSIESRDKFDSKSL